jgi:AcrR family transcriptional regulator
MTDSRAAQGDASPRLSEQKHRQILQAAARLFMSQGYETTTVDAIAQLAGVSKATVYAHAGSKQELFVSVLNGRCGELWRSLEAMASESADIGASLREVGRRFLDLILSQDGLDMYRLVVTESARNPALGRAFYMTGPGPLLARVADLLAASRSRGELAMGEAGRAAEVFFGILQSHHQLPRLIGVASALSPAEREATVEESVALFLKAYRPG